MGSEAANVHLGSKRQTASILNDLHSRKSKWLQEAATRMARVVENDWNRYRKSLVHNLPSVLTQHPIAHCEA